MVLRAYLWFYPVQNSLPKWSTKLSNCVHVAPEFMQKQDLYEHIDFSPLNSLSIQNVWELIFTHLLVDTLGWHRESAVPLTSEIERFLPQLQHKFVQTQTDELECCSLGLHNSKHDNNSNSKRFQGNSHPQQDQTASGSKNMGACA